MAGFGQPAEPCPCGGERYANCCEPFHLGKVRPVSAEQLMRSRYSAYSRDLIDYLIETHPSELPQAQRRQALKASNRGVRWTRLRITATEAGEAGDLTGTVTFEAHYRQAGHTNVLRECSRFGRQGEVLEGRWLYLDAEA
ncbi:YchJ family protein [Synechococcus sp. W4D4]|uniref:YchJ family protein n=1 Tax=Synechococcus sp. W4D4 TaxID=3392294 RepID=UPI0039E87A8B